VLRQIWVYDSKGQQIGWKNECFRWTFIFSALNKLEITEYNIRKFI